MLSEKGSKEDVIRNTYVSKCSANFDMCVINGLNYSRSVNNG